MYKNCNIKYECTSGLETGRWQIRICNLPAACHNIGTAIFADSDADAGV